MNAVSLWGGGAPLNFGTTTLQASDSEQSQSLLLVWLMFWFCVLRSGYEQDVESGDTSHLADCPGT